MAKTLIFALHGFLGRASDWQTVLDRTPQFEFICGEMFSEKPFVWPELTIGKQKKIFLGYSLGGRLGLKALAANPGAFDHYVFLSTNPGFPLSDEEARQQRQLEDAGWARKISRENWAHFLKEWNSQAVFQTGAIEPQRLLSDFNCEKLVHALREHSLGLQPDYRKIIEENRDKITWVVGNRDAKYCALAASLRIEPVFVNAGHRILFENPAAISDILTKIKEQLGR